MSGVTDNNEFLNIIPEGNTTAESTGITVSKLNEKLTEDFISKNTNVYKAIAPNGSEYIVFRGTTGEFSELTGGKKSRKSKTHKQKKVHRSTQKRNGRKKTSSRRK